MKNPNWIFVDVDGTLIVGNRANKRVVEWLKRKKENGYVLVLWSMQGQEHAINAARQCECAQLFAHIISKPGHIVDNRGLAWLKNVHVTSLDQYK